MAEQAAGGATSLLRGPNKPADGWAVVLGEGADKGAFEDDLVVAGL